MRRNDVNSWEVISILLTIDQLNRLKQLFFKLYEEYYSRRLLIIVSLVTISNDSKMPSQVIPRTINIPSKS